MQNHLTLEQMDIERRVHEANLAAWNARKAEGEAARKRRLAHAIRAAALLQKSARSSASR